ncbi:Protein polyglycylase TTLL10 [Triplophysa tibetana]|uniref:Protein polyglycylase TTLL10 n=1 Tax=Triplophysa tibetana TaxID=1572043 RepID=A0A5A9NDG0_9TELE|nr:Protein polyglycylase TTLL10 [Triplophysa tibetana]
MESPVSSAQIHAGCWGVTVMSLVSCVEPHRPREEPDAGQRPDQQHVLQMTEDREQSDEKEMDDTLNAEGEVNKDEQQKENKEIWRKGAIQKIQRRRLKQRDGTLAGGQLLYQIPNNKVLTTKIGLLNSLREYERVSSKVNYGRVNRRMKIEDFFPVTYRMDVKDEREAFFNGVCNDKSSMWICKPTGLNQGRGIFLMRTPEEIAAFRERLQGTTEQQTNKRSPLSLQQARVVQQWKRMEQIIMHCFQAVKAKLDSRLGYFDLFGCDFLIDENFKIWLLEMNCNPALHTNCEVLKEVIPSTVTETLDLALEIFKKCCCGQKLLPLNNQRDFVLLYDGESMAMKKQMQKTSGSVASFNPNNTCKTYKSTFIATPGWKSTNRGAKCPISGVTTEPPAKRLATSTVSVWSNTSPLSQQPIELSYKPLGGAAVTKKTRFPRTQETNQLRLHQPKSVHARVELHLSKCTWHEPVTSKLNVPPHVLPVRSAIRSLSTPSLSKASHSTHGVGAQSMLIDNRDHISSNLKTSKIYFAHVDKREPKEKDG